MANRRHNWSDQVIQPNTRSIPPVEMQKKKIENAEGAKERQRK